MLEWPNQGKKQEQEYEVAQKR